MPRPPKVVLVMRHAEKPADPYDPDLSPAGYDRAETLARYAPETFGVPDFIFAAAISKHSARPYETVKPLSKRTGVPIDATIADQDYCVLASDLLSGTYADQHGVICWHHGHIPALMQALGAENGDYPDPWDPEVFNLILKVDLSTKPPTVTKITEPF